MHRIASILALSLLAVTAISAHPGHVHDGASAAAHTFGGLDHLALAALAGILSWRLSRLPRAMAVVAVCACAFAGLALPVLPAAVAWAAVAGAGVLALLARRPALNVLGLGLVGCGFASSIAAHPGMSLASVAGLAGVSVAIAVVVGVATVPLRREEPVPARQQS